MKIVWVWKINTLYVFINKEDSVEKNIDIISMFMFCSKKIDVLNIIDMQSMSVCEFGQIR